LKLLVVMALFAGTLTGCSTNKFLATAISNQLASQGTDFEEDLLLARDAAPFFLKFGESVLAKVPDHRPLSETLAAGFVRYSWAFVAFEADKIESRDSREALRLRERAVRLYARAETHAMRALEQHHPGISEQLRAVTHDQVPIKLLPNDAGVAYWACAAWSSRIALSKGNAEALAELPSVIRLANALATCCESWGGGAVPALMGSLEAGRPGGRLVEAQGWFDKAEKLSGGRNAGLPLARAESIALPLGDRADFERLVHRSIAIAKSNPGIENAIMLERANWLLETIDDRF
jgi:TRAP transporter T-component